MSGRAMISPRNPRSEPQMERDSRSTAGFSPIALPMILGVRYMSCIICTTA